VGILGFLARLKSEYAPNVNPLISTNQKRSRKMNEVKVTEIKMPFMSMVTFMVKWAFAAIPAGIIIFFIWLCLSGLVMATLRSM